MCYNEYIQNKRVHGDVCYNEYMMCVITNISQNKRGHGDAMCVITKYLITRDGGGDMCQN